MALLAEQIPENRRIVAIGPVGIADLRRALRERLVGLGGRAARHPDPRQIALHNAHEPRDADRGENFGKPRWEGHISETQSQKRNSLAVSWMEKTYELMPETHTPYECVHLQKTK